MKIGLIGTHNTGKTTTLHQIATALKLHKFDNFAILPETVRDCPYFGTKELFMTQLWTLQTQIFKELDLSKKWTHVIVDRTVFDPVIYYDVLTGRAKTTVQWKEYDFLLHSAWRWEKFQPYDLLFLFRPMPMEDRRLNPKYQPEIDSKFLAFFNTRWFKDKIVEVQEPDLQKRAESVAQIVLEKLKNV